MRCETALERMLEADPAELGVGPAWGEGSELTRHLSQCERCAAVAEMLRSELAELDEGLATFAMAGDADDAVDRALAESRPPAAAARRKGARWRRALWLPVAAAAVLAVLVVGGEPELPGPSSPVEGRPEEARGVVITPPADRGAVVMSTANPKITIVWLYEREG